MYASRWKKEGEAQMPPSPNWMEICVAKIFKNLWSILSVESGQVSVNYLNYSRLFELRLIIWILVNYLNIGQLFEFPSIIWIFVDYLNYGRLFEYLSNSWISVNYLNFDQLFEFRSIIWISINYLNFDQLFEFRSIIWILVENVSNKLSPSNFGQISDQVT
jgi:hypothetical protein